MNYPNPYSPFMADDPMQDAMIASKAMHNRPRFDFNDRGPAMMERKIAEKMLLDKQQTEGGYQVSTPLTTGEMIPSIGGKQPPQALRPPAPAAPTQITLPSNERAARGQPFDTATEGRLRNVPGAYETAMQRLVPQAPMTATFNGQQFTAQPAPRMDRRAMEQMIAQKMLAEREAKAQKQLDDARQFKLQEARIPGEASLNLANAQGENARRLVELKAKLDEPLTALERKKVEAQIANIEQERTQSASTFANTQQDRERRLAIEGSPEQMQAKAQWEAIADNPNIPYETKVAVFKLAFPNSAPGIADGIAKPNSVQAQTTIESNPLLKQGLDGLAAFAQQLSKESTAGINMLQPQDLAKFKAEVDAFVQQLIRNNVDEQTARDIVRSRIEAVIPRELTQGKVGKSLSSFLTGIGHPLGALLEGGRALFGQPGTPGQNVRSAVGP